MKLSEHIKWAVASCEETDPSLIRKYLIKEHGVEVCLTEIKAIQTTLQKEFERVQSDKA